MKIPSLSPLWGLAVKFGSLLKWLALLQVIVFQESEGHGAVKLTEGEGLEAFARIERFRNPFVLCESLCLCGKRMNHKGTKGHKE